MGQTLQQPDSTMFYVYPAGGQQGQTVDVEFGGMPGLTGANDVLVEGPPGISVKGVKVVSPTMVQASLSIAKDASPGIRLLRLRGVGSGLTNFRSFFVGRLPEVVEKEPNNLPARAEDVTLPAVINGRLDPEFDVDCFRFQAKAEQRIVAGVLGHGMDSRMRNPAGGGGFLDTNLELLDEKGKVLAAADDNLGLDPLLEHIIKTDGKYILRIQALSNKGSKSAVYRLTVGEVPYPTFVFPPGGQRGQKVAIEFAGPHIPQGTRQDFAVPGQGASPWLTILFNSPLTDGRELPFVRGEFPELIEKEPNNEAAQAMPLAMPVTVNARFDKPGDADWYRIALKKGRGVVLQTTAQRHLRSPVDTLVEIFDEAGKKLAEDDDGPLFAGQCAHDFKSGDSWLLFEAPKDGSYLVRVSDQNGTGGPHAIYRLTAEPLRPDFMLYQWPDAVPIWGPGTTASFVVQLHHWGNLNSEIELKVEGLPPGWKGSTTYVSPSYYGIYRPPTQPQPLLTITAPPDAAIGSVATFKVVGRAKQDGKVIEREAQPLTLYGSAHNDRMHLRFSPQARAVVAGHLDCSLETSAKELTGEIGGTVNIPVTVHRRADMKRDIGISIDGPTVAAATGWRTPLALKSDQNQVTLPLTINPETRPGTYGIVVSRAWAADIRAGRPGPCTPIIILHVKAKGK